MLQIVTRKEVNMKVLTGKKFTKEMIEDLIWEFEKRRISYKRLFWMWHVKKPQDRDWECLERYMQVIIDKEEAKEKAEKREKQETSSDKEMKVFFIILQ